MDINGTNKNDNLLGTSEDDVIYGGEGNDSVDGKAGNDQVYGQEGNDTLNGGDGDDYFSEEAEADFIAGGKGNDQLDLYSGDAGLTVEYTDFNNGTTSLGGKIKEIESFIFRGGKGKDKINVAAAGYADLRSGKGDDTLIAGASDDYLEGGSGNDSVDAGVGNDRVYGQEGNDTLNGGEGDDYFSEEAEADEIAGGKGNDQLDLYSGDAGLTVEYTDFNNGTTSLGGKIKEIESFIFRGGKGKDKIDVSAAGYADLRSGEGDDTLIAGASYDYLEGGSGNDSVDAGVGNDRVYGQEGNDTLNGGEGDDYVDGGDGIDLLKVDYSKIKTNGIATTTNEDGSVNISAAGNSIHYVNIEKLDITGTTQADNFIGSNLQDTLKGGAGNDIFTGAGGKDSLVGGKGHDIYIVKTTGDTIAEQTTEGLDTVETSVDYSLETIANVEYLTLTGKANLKGTGNNINNRITGNSANNSLIGNAGNDTLVGNAGNDSLQGGEGKDLLIGVDENAAKSGLGEIDTLQGGVGDDRFILGNGTKSFYDDGKTSTNGKDDYALIKDFKSSEDVIELAYPKSQYRLDVSPIAGISGTAIYLDKSGSEPDELVGIVEGVSNLDLNSSAFVQSNLVGGGLEAEYYDGYFNDDLNFFNQNQPVFKRTDANVNFDDSTDWQIEHTSLADLQTFSVRWQGYINIPITGEYTFYVNSDDGSYLFLDDAVFSPSVDNATVNNGGLHPPQEGSGKTYLKAGLHDISIVYGDNENGGASVARFSWSSQDAGITKKLVPSSVLFSREETASSAGTLAFSQPTYSINEDGTSVVAITVNRTGESSGEVSATIALKDITATASDDYDNSSIEVTFGDGDTTPKTITIPIVNDTKFEPKETINLTLTDPQGGVKLGEQSSAIVSIISEDPPQPGTLAFSAPEFSVREDGTAIAEVTVTRTGGSDLEVSATINLSDGTATASDDYDRTPITVTFAEGDTEAKTITIPVVSDKILEPDETINLILTNPTNGATIGEQNGATFTIADRDASFITGFPRGALGSNQGQATILISGHNFSKKDIVSIIAPDKTKLKASKVTWESDTALWATFDLTGLTPGQYDVKLNSTQGSFVVKDSFTVTDGPVGNLQIALSYPQNGVVTVTYTNVGETDLIPPVLKVSGTNAKVYEADSTVAGLYLGTSNDGPLEMLAPGASGEFSFNYTPKGNGEISFSVEQLKSNDVIDWANIKAESRPAEIGVEAWDAIWQNFTTSVGSTAAEFQAAMLENANYLSQLGEKSNNLFDFELKQAANTFRDAKLVTTTDITDVASGLDLTFSRTFSQSIADRYHLGALGRGWTHQWDLQLAEDGSKVIIRSADNSERYFQRYSYRNLGNQTVESQYIGSNGAIVTVKQQGNSSNYTLSETDGTTYKFSGNKKLTYVEDANKNRITFEYTGDALTRLVHSNGDNLTLNYNTQGRISKITNSTGETSNYTYDASGEHLLTVTNSQGATTYTYDTGNIASSKHALLSITSPSGTQQNFKYDNQGRLISESKNEGAEARTYSYDKAGGVTITDATGAKTDLLYGVLGNPLEIRLPQNQTYQNRLDGSILPDGSQYSYHFHDGEIHDGEVHNGVLEVTNPLNQKTTFNYDSNFNNLLGFQDAQGNSVNYTYDSKQNLTKITYADGSTEKFKLDAAGNVISFINRRGSEIQSTYNKDGQITSKQYQDGAKVSYTYDTQGNLLTVTDASGKIEMKYDSANRMTGISYPSGRSLQFSYNADGQRTKMVAQDGNTVNYSYDAVGRLTGLTDGAKETIVAYEYDKASRLTKETNGNGTYTTYKYDQLGQVNSLVNYKTDGTVNSSFDYVYDELGRRTSMITLEGTYQYGYDATGQLTSVKLPDGGNIQYRYDDAGNRSMVVVDGDMATGYQSNNLNQYTSINDATYTYDKDGNLIGKTAKGKNYTYAYDVENRLVSVTTPDGTWDYEYDALGNRISSTHKGQRTEYLLDPTGLGDVIAEYNGSGNLISRYNHGLGLVNQVNSSNSTNYYDFDALGSTVGLSGTNGDYVNQYSYLPFGEELTKTEVVANPFEYVGQWGVMDESNGLEFMRARFYDATTGKFLSPDPIGINAGDTNFYRYVGNSSVNFVDSSGKFWGKLVPSAISIVIKKLYPDKNLILSPRDYVIFINCKAQRIFIQAGEILDGTYNPPRFDLCKLSGNSWGDPHLNTFDGIPYDFQGAGEFTLVKSTTDDFEIQTRQEPWGDSSASYNTAVALKIDGQRIGIYADRSEPMVNGKTVNIPDGGIFAMGESLIFRQGDSYTINSSENDQIQVDLISSFINVSLSSDRQGKVVGLLGNANGDPKDDFALRKGTVLGNSLSNEQLYGKYGNSWRITQAQSLFDYAPGTDTKTFTDRTFPEKIVTIDTLDPELRAKAEKIARDAGITDPELLENAILDIALTDGAEEFIEGYSDQQEEANLNADNTLINPEGEGTEHWLAASSVIPYTIRFTNSAEDETSPVAQVIITQQLDSDLDLNTFTLDDFGFGDMTIEVPLGVQNYSQRLDLQDTRGIFVDASAKLNSETGVVTWTFTTIDPATGNLVTDLSKGFLPPNDEDGAGQGSIGYSIQPKADAKTGTRIDSQATITFDNQTPIQTPLTFNTLHGDLPTSVDKTINIEEDTSYSFVLADFSLEDSNTGENSEKVTLVTLPTKGKLTLNGENVTVDQEISLGDLSNLKFTPDKNKNGDGYTDFQFQISDAQNYSTQPTTITFDVNPVDDAPTVSKPIANVTVKEDAKNTTIDLSKVFKDVDGDTIVKTVKTNSNKTLVNATIKDNLLTLDYQPDRFGTAKITISGTAQEKSINAPFTVKVNSVNDAPIVQQNLESKAVVENKEFQFTIPNNTFFDADPQDLLTYKTSTLPSWLTFDPKTLTFIGKANPSDIGTHKVTVTATDKAGAKTSNTFTLTVLKLLSGSSNNDTIAGTSANEYLAGDAGNDTLKAGKGNDLLNGGKGTDSMLGAIGDDTYSVDLEGDLAIEKLNQGKDTVKSAISYTLPKHTENLFLTNPLLSLSEFK